MNDKTRLALIRTLLAEERNYISIQRTALSELRTGISLAIIAPSTAATLTYILNVFVAETTTPIEIIISIISIFLTIFGIYLTIYSYSELKKARAVQRLIRNQEIKLIEGSELTKDYCKDMMSKVF